MKDIRAESKINKGQAAMEYMTMIGLSLLILMGLLVVVYFMTSSASDQINMNTAHETVNKLKEKADFVYIHGYPTTITVYANIPENVEESNLSTYIGSPGGSEGKTINLGMKIGDEINDIYAVTRGNVEGEIPTTKGYYVFVVKSRSDGGINITYVK